MDPLGPILAIFLVLLYCLPAIVAALRDHHQRSAIVVLNLFLGWTFLGWVAALVWAATAVREDLKKPKPETSSRW